MTVDWDGQIRMDALIILRYAEFNQDERPLRHILCLRYRHDRHGIVNQERGPCYNPTITLQRVSSTSSNIDPSGAESCSRENPVSSQMIDRIHRQSLPESLRVPVGFKWFVTAYSTARLASGERRGAKEHPFVRLDGSVWTTEKDGIILSLLAAEITARMGRDPGEIYN